VPRGKEYLHEIRRYIKMKKSILALTSAVLVLSSAFAFAGCGGAQSSASGQASQAATTVAATEAQKDASAVTAQDVQFVYNGVTIELNSDAADLTEKLGQPNDVQSQMSCHGEGEDKTYSYNGFTVNSYPLNGKDYVMEVVVNEAGIPTSKGVAVGDPVSKVTEAYGNNYKAVGVYYSYDAGNKMELRFLIENDKVTEIDYYYNV
jgi:uncharacterized protein (UPF0333 family)